MDSLDPVQEDIASAIRKAEVLKRRGDEAGAASVLAEIAEKYESHPGVLELKADALIAQGKLTEARDILSDVIKHNPGRIDTEKKHAQLVFQLAQREMAINAVLGDDFAALMNPAGAKKPRGVGSMLSLMMPGFGQIYNGELIKGLIFTCVAIATWIGMLTLGLNRQLAGTYPDGSPKYVTKATSLFWPAVVALLAVYIVGMIDAAVTSKKSQSFDKPFRPVPPVDKPFE